jgi:hypothetical protein
MTRPEPHIVRAKKREIAVRHRNGRKFSQAPIRVAELDRLFEHRYGPTLPDDDAGRDDTWIMVHHIALMSVDVEKRIRSWLARRTPWMQPDEIEAMITNVFAKAVRWRAETLGKRVRLTWIERCALRIGTFRAFDMSKAESDAIRIKNKRIGKTAKRRRSGIKPRHQYEANAIGHGKPWIAEGISKATWYRRQRRPLQWAADSFRARYPR